jgi:hypothetical protein
MSDIELQQIIISGLTSVDMTIDEPAIEEICQLAKGLPHYAHLLGLSAGRAALNQKTLRVVENHVQIAVKEAIAKAQASIQSDYSKAVTSSRQEALYTQVLLACAMAQTDEMGWFYPRDVREPLGIILQREYKIESFARHLHSFCQDQRGPILIANGKSDHPRFRFENPLMQPYVLIRGLAEQMIKPEDLKRKKERERFKELF